MASGVLIYEMTGTISPPVSVFLWTQLWQSGEIIIISIGFYYLIKAGVSSLAIHIFLYVFVMALIFWAIADPIVFSIAGDHITPKTLAHFAGFRIFLSDDLWLPIKKHSTLVFFGLLSIFVLLYLIYRAFKKSYLDFDPSLNNRILTTIYGIGIVILFMPKVFGITYLGYPAEILYLRDYYDWNRYFPDNEDIRILKNRIISSDTINWKNTDFPLSHSPQGIPNVSTPPDIFLLVLESFRAEDSKLYNPENGKMLMSSLDKIANHGIVFPYFISNGFPSTEGFFSILTGTWPHSRDRIVQNYQNVAFDNIASHLGRMGYQTVRIENDPNLYEEGYWVRKYFKKSITFADRNIFPSEKNMVNEIIDFIANHDSTAASPLFIHFKAKTPHYPYEVPNDETRSFEDMGNPSENYLKSMEYVNKHILRLYEFLQSRKRSENTVLIVLGDHANYLDKSTATALPVDDVLWTGAIISGPSQLIGHPKFSFAHASQVDIMPTVLALAGDNSPRATVGRNLLDTAIPDNETFAIAIRPAGVRIDMGGYTHIVDRRHPSKYIKYPAFGGLMQRAENFTLDLKPQELLKIADTWSYLIEENKVWPPILFTQIQTISQTAKE